MIGRVELWCFATCAEWCSVIGYYSFSLQPERERVDYVLLYASMHEIVCRQYALSCVYLCVCVNSSHNWNTVFMNPNAVAEAMADRYHVEKSDILDDVGSFMAFFAVVASLV